MPWFSKTSVYDYETLRDDIKTIIHMKIDKRIQCLYESNKYMFQINVGNSVLLTRDSYVKHIPKQVYFDSVARVLNSSPFIIYPEGDDCLFNVCIVQNPSLPSPPSLSPRLARAAIYQAQDANEICAITLEPLRRITVFAVSQCGHVFDRSASELDSCPLCKTFPVAWTVCSPLPEPVTIGRTDI